MSDESAEARGRRAVVNVATDALKRMATLEADKRELVEGLRGLANIVKAAGHFMTFGPNQRKRIEAAEALIAKHQVQS